MSDISFFSISLGIKQQGRIEDTSVRTEYNFFTNSIDNTVTISWGDFEIASKSVNIQVGKEVQFLNTLEFSNLLGLYDDIDGRIGGLKFDKFSHKESGVLFGGSFNFDEAGVRVGVGSKEYNVYLEAGINIDAILDSEIHQFPSFDPWGHPLHRVDEDGTPQYGPSYTAQRDDNDRRWGLDTPTERQGHQPGGGKPTPSIAQPNRSPGMLGGRTNAAESRSTRSTQSDSIDSLGGGNRSRGIGSREAAENYGRSYASASRSRGSRGSLANSPEASPSQRAGARTRAPASSYRGSPGSLANSPEASPSQRQGARAPAPGSLASSPEASPSRRPGAHVPATQISYEQDFGYSGGRNAGSPSVGRGSNSHDGTRGYNEAPSHSNGWGDHSPGSGGRGGGGSSGKPILFDLNGDGISITERDDSTHYFDIGGDGYDHRTAWAGIGDGVLVIDADGDGQISGKKEVVFTDWDPSADSDMEALRQVFDTNGNGLLDAGDAAWSNFYIMVTQADGSTVMKGR